MRHILTVRATALAAALCLMAPLAQAQTFTPRQIQGQIASGNEVAALSELQTVLAANPHSGVGWYLTAEAQDAAGNEPAARAALNNAQTYAPGLPFADPAKAAALSAHINGASRTSTYAPAPTPAPVRHGSSLITGLIILVVAFFAIRMFLRSRRRYATPYQQPGQAYGPGPGGQPYGPGGMPYGPGGGMGGGIGSGLLGGLAAGAGFAAGERVIDNMMGNRNQNIDQTSFNEPTVDPGPQDDGLSGNPGWDNSSDDNNIDPGTSW